MASLFKYEHQPVVRSKHLAVIRTVMMLLIIAASVIILTGGCSAPTTHGDIENEMTSVIDGEHVLTDKSSLTYEAESTDKPENISVTVETVGEFFKAIGSNKTINLKPGIYKLEELIDTDIENPNASFQTERDGNSLGAGELVIQGIENLSITGIGDKHVEILTNSQNSNVLTFKDSKNIALTNIRAGHYPDKGGCYGGVAVFKDSSNISIEHCDFFGCGINGLELCNAGNVIFSDSVIEECSFHILCMSNSSNVTFLNSEFVNNNGTELINISGCLNVLFDKCNFADNTGDTDIGIMFNIDSGFSAYVSPFERNGVISDIKIKNSIIQNNQTVSDKIARAPDESAKSLVFEETEFVGNNFANEVIQM